MSSHSIVKISSPVLRWSTPGLVTKFDVLARSGVVIFEMRPESSYPERESSLRLSRLLHLQSCTHCLQCAWMLVIAVAISCRVCLDWWGLQALARLCDWPGRCGSLQQERPGWTPVGSHLINKPAEHIFCVFYGFQVSANSLLLLHNPHPTESDIHMDIESSVSSRNLG